MPKENYLGNSLLKGKDVKIEWSEELLQEYLKCKDDPMYFAENYIHIVDVDKGFVKIKLYDYQKEIIEKIYRSKKIVANCARQSGKTTTAVCVILHYVLFNKYKTVALLSNKGDSAREILYRIQSAYEALPKWLQQGVLEWNKGSIEFENGCRILAGATSSSSIRGKTCVTGDNRVCIERNDGFYFTKIENLVNKNEFFSEEKNTQYVVYRTENILTKETFVGFRKINLSDVMIENKLIFKDGYLGNSEELKRNLEKYGPIVMKQDLLFFSEDEKEIKKYISQNNQTNLKLNFKTKILSEGKFRDFDGFRFMGIREIGTLVVENGIFVKCTPDHKFLTDDGVWKEAQFLTQADFLGGYEFKFFVKNNEREKVYDAINVKETNSFYINGLTAHNCSFLYIDEAAYVEGFDEFFSSVYPTISSGEDTKLFLTSTPYGLNHFYEIFINAKKNLNNYEWIEVPWHRVPGRDEKWKEETLKSLNFDMQKFDAEFNIEFLGSAGNLLSKTALEEITNNIRDPIRKNELGVKQYKLPEKDRVYACVADVSRGKGLDYCAFHIIDITEDPFEQVCTFHSNMIVPLDFAVILNEMGNMYNCAYMLVENNDVGAQVVDSLHFDYEYDNILYTQNKGMKGKVLSQGFGGSGDNERGIRTTKPVKNQGCSNIKILIENGKLKIYDYETVNEFYSFIKRGQSYEAEPGKNDDLVMCLVLFGWLNSQSYFRELSDLDIQKTMRERSEQELYDSLAPFGIIWDGRDEQDEFLIKDVDDF